jgi:cytochrome oxidase Cu insertion factor (SCO1/SenC/PrrC family)
VALAAALKFDSSAFTGARSKLDCVGNGEAGSCEVCEDLPLSSKVEATIPDLLATSLTTAWVRSEQRRRLRNLDITFIDQDERSGRLADLLDRPALVAFYYTRCENSGKCSAVISRMASLQRDLASLNMVGSVRLLAITYEPGFDTPERMKQYGIQRGLSTDEWTIMIQLDPLRHAELTDELEYPVSYNAGWVNTHGVELNLIDAKARYVRKYHTKVWDNGQVIEDLKRLLNEAD